MFDDMISMLDLNNNDKRFEQKDMMGIAQNKVKD